MTEKDRIGDILWLSLAPQHGVLLKVLATFPDLAGTPPLNSHVGQNMTRRNCVHVYVVLT
jgi:hypothetical protein